MQPVNVHFSCISCKKWIINKKSLDCVYTVKMLAAWILLLFSCIDAAFLNLYCSLKSNLPFTLWASYPVTDLPDHPALRRYSCPDKYPISLKIRVQTSVLMTKLFYVRGKTTEVSLQTVIFAENWPSDYTCISVTPWYRILLEELETFSSFNKFLVCFST